MTETENKTGVRSLSIVMPCLNEAVTLETCISRAKKFLSTLEIPSEIIIADNGSTDGSIEMAINAGVKCLKVQEKGYGAALHYGIMAASGSHIIFGDSDDSYHFDECRPFYEKLNQGADLVVGNRFRGGVEKNAMPFLHRYLGTPVISFMGRTAFEVPFTDFNCGLRAISKSAYLELGMQARGMDFITEMLAKAGHKKMTIEEVPVRLYKDGRNRPPHLKTWQDGWRQFRQIIMLSPKWPLLFPALFFLILGLVIFSALLFSRIRIASVNLDIHTFFFGSVFFLLGLQLFLFYLLMRFYGFRMEYHSLTGFEARIFRTFRFEKGLLLGALVFLAGLLLSSLAVLQWANADFGDLNPMRTFRLVIPGGMGIMAGAQIIVFSFLLHALVTFKVKFENHPPQWLK
ncbi:hypothetical protein BC349_16980 [Flavihumibacter stibioxidans]|uniref:Glycosyltransferase 2-like domain-containing protein n=2 Tax=Flavihumibacter stibioxidans TaxID=1834163 RepID=A0ABR7MCK4_9BACT|nr:hypothetical protein [Flavihumibacter stibioxidans]